MYEAFYGLTEKPFNLTPDQKFLYLSEKHKEAFAHLLYGIKNRSGFVMVTGEIGTGKTTICRNLLKQLDEGETEIAFIFNPALNPVELLKKINTEFGVSDGADTSLELVEALNAYLLDAARRGINCVLVIDEAQNLAPQVLEQIRLLSNLETETAKLLQIILIGQPELGEKLALHELRQLNQRITARYHLKALNEKETLQYIAYRLHVAGGHKKVRFARNAIRAVHRLSGGTPRVINAICDRALLIGYTKEARILTKAIVRRAAHEIRGERIRPPKSWRGRFAGVLPSPALTIIAAMVILSVYTLVQGFAPSLREMARSLDRFTQLFTPADFNATTPPPESGDTVEASVNQVGSAAQMSPDELRDALQQSPIYQKIREQLNPAPETPAPLLTFLRETGAMEARTGALRALASAWGIELTLGMPETDDAAELVEFAASLGVSCEVLEPALDQILAINYPALVRMERPEGTCWMALLGATKDGVTLSAGGGGTMEAGRADFAAHYTGEALYWWQDPNPDAGNLLQGQGGRAVAALKAQLRARKHLDAAETSNSYDSQTARAVARLQAESGLGVDGIAGKQVRMVLSSWDADSHGPKLWGAVEEEMVAAVDVPKAETVGDGADAEAAAHGTAEEVPAAEADTPAAEAPRDTREAVTRVFDNEDVREAAAADTDAGAGPRPEAVTERAPEAAPAPVVIPEAAIPAEGELEIEELPEPTAYNGAAATKTGSSDA